MKTLSSKEGREIFERVHGRVSDSLWYRLKKVFDESLPMTEQNITWVAGIKKTLPRCDITSISVVSSVKHAKQFLLESTQITGKELLNLFDQYGITIHRNTLTNWFRPINGFSQRRTYTAKEITPIILAAHTYKLRKQLESSEVVNGRLN